MLEAGAWQASLTIFDTNPKRRGRDCAAFFCILGSEILGSKVQGLRIQGLVRFVLFVLLVELVG
jgi:hypothetical protein